MNRIISDTAEYGCYLFDHACKPLLSGFMSKIEADVIGETYGEGYDNGVDNVQLIAVNKAIRQHPVEIVGEKLRSSMTAMKKLI
jgi:ketol-acid reductoisomerase